MFGWLFGKKDAAPAQPTAAQVLDAAEKILDAYGELLETRPIAIEVADEKELPYPKETILNALRVGLMSGEYDEAGLTINAILLAQFQPGVGPERLHGLGFDPSKVDVRSMDPELLLEKVTGNPEARARCEAFQPVIERDRERIKAAIAGAQAASRTAV